jgi:tetratricopeptide (TPR) repeat protein
MSEHIISFEEAQTNLLAGAAFIADSVDGNDDRDEAIQEIVPLYLEKGEVDLAAQLADTVDDSFIRDRLLIRVAEKCAAIGDDEYALQLAEAIEDESLQNAAREQIVFQHAVKGEFEKAFDLTETLSFKDNAFADIALHQAIGGDETSARATVAKIDFPQAKVTALQNIAEQHLQKGDNARAVELLDEAVENAHETDFSEAKIRELFHLADDFVTAKRNDRAIEIYDEAKTFAEEIDTINRDNLLATAALGFLEAGSLELADRTLDLVADKTQLASCLLGFAQVFWNKDEHGEALETLEEAFAILKSQRDNETRDSKARLNLWTQIAVQFAGFDKWERAIEIAQSNPSPSEQMSALAQIAQICAAQNRDELARQAVAAIADDADRMFALIGVAAAKNQAGEPEKALVSLTEAAALGETVPQFTVRSQAFSELARRFHENGASERARQISLENLNVIHQIRNPAARATALARLGNIYDQFKFDLNDAEKTALLKVISRV